jgi:hypothetical protein
MESDVDAAMAIGMDTEFMRINAEIDKMIQECPQTGSGRAKKIALLDLKRRILDSSVMYGRQE